MLGYGAQNAADLGPADTGGQAPWGTHLLTAMGLLLVGRQWPLLGEALPGAWPLHRDKG